MVGWGGGGGGVLLISSEGGNWKIFWVWNFRFRDFFGYDFIYAGIFAYLKQFEVVICMLLMKQKMFLGVPSVFWVLLETLGLFLGGWFLS